MPFDYNAVKDLLRCPKSHSLLVHVDDALICENPECRLRFEIRDGIPILLLDEATELSAADWRTAVERPGEVDR